MDVPVTVQTDGHNSVDGIQRPPYSVWEVWEVWPYSTPGRSPSRKFLIGPVGAPRRSVLGVMQNEEAKNLALL